MGKGLAITGFVLSILVWVLMFSFGLSSPLDIIFPIIIVAILIFNLVISIKIKDGRIFSIIGLIVGVLTIIYLIWAYSMAGYFSV